MKKQPVSIIVNKDLLRAFDRQLRNDGYGSRGRSAKLEELMREYIKTKPIIEWVQGEPEWAGESV